jgi:hypothetical protein
MMVVMLVVHVDGHVDGHVGGYIDSHVGRTCWSDMDQAMVFRDGDMDTARANGRACS